MSEVPVVSLTLSPQWMALSQHAFHEVQPTHLRDLLKDADRCAALHSTLPLADPYARAARCVAPLEWAVPHWCAPDGAWLAARATRHIARRVGKA